MSFYQSIAPYYDYIFPPSAMQVAFINSKMGGVRSKQILEAGCGTGNLALKLAEQKVLVEGIDLDPEMVSAAREKAGASENVRFTQMDILKLSEKWPPNTFDAVVSFGNTLVHLIDKQQIRQFFLNAKDVLKPDGMLMVQIIHYDRILDQEIGGLPTIDNDEIRFERFYDFNESEDVVDFRTFLTVKKSGKEIRNSVKLLPLRKGQTERLLQECGFKNIRFYGSFKEDDLTSDSVPLIFTAQK
ncbi:class I SAM-dependent methyltransferase [Marinilabilia salmonicolor]|uniref:class I SAM-dependent methyltransferase n=1 Tax=Marinilabilia salmonicolor TaxID=989 RepID=UPI000299EDCF|nr:class I SAM-dependent methyltransferase [Marinilabilia salmonicolor]